MNNKEKYQSIRKIGMELNDNILASIPRNHINKGARLLNVMRMNKISFQNEGEQYRFYDFIINDCLDSNDHWNIAITQLLKKNHILA